MKDNFPEILERIRAGDDGAFGELLGEYSSLIEGAVRRFEPSFRDIDSMYGTDDLRQCASMAVYRAVMKYDTEMASDVSFGLYAKICVNNALISELRRSKTEVKRRSALKKSRDDAQMFGNGQSVCSADEIISAAGEMLDGLSDFERQVFEYYVSGRKVREIAALVGRDSKSVSNAVFRMKEKIKSRLSK